MKRRHGFQQGSKSGLRQTEQEREALIASTAGLRARIAAHLVIQDVVSSGHLLDERFSPHSVPSRVAGLDARDRGLARSIATVVMRRLGTLRHVLGQFLDKGMPREAGALEWILLAGAAQILFLDVPDHATVDLAVRAARLETKSAPYASLVNAVLRNVARGGPALAEGCDALDFDTPPWLAQRWRRNWGEMRARAIADAHRLEPTLDITVRADLAGWASKLGGRVLPTGSLRLETHEPVTELEGYADGDWWVQDAGAALPARLLGVEAGERVLDLCAAPGGKTAQLAAAGAQVTALDKSAERLKLLAANLERLGLHASLVVADAAAYAADTFDAVLVDPPCTATGTIRRHPDVPWTKKPGDVEALAGLQSRILDRAAGLVRAGGRLVYCTCSIEPEEGENQITALLRRNPDLRRDPVAPGEFGIPAEFLNEAGELRTLPDLWPAEDGRQAGIDGFFAARLRRQG
jgi:16S rRNA (cytosine967-C5)-methyltransferase